MTDPLPRTLRRELPLSVAFTRAASRLAARRWPSCLRIRGFVGFSAQEASPRRARRGGASPRSRSARTPHVTNPCPHRPDQPVRMVGTKSPRARRRTTQAPSARGLRHPAFREEDRDPSTRGAFHTTGSSEEPAPVVHKLSPTCGVTGCGAFLIAMLPEGVDVPHGIRRLNRPGDPPKQTPAERLQRPLDFCE